MESKFCFDVLVTIYDLEIKITMVNRACELAEFVVPRILTYFSQVRYFFLSSLVDPFFSLLPPRPATISPVGRRLARRVLVVSLEPARIFQLLQLLPRHHEPPRS